VALYSAANVCCCCCCRRRRRRLSSCPLRAPFGNLRQAVIAGVFTAAPLLGGGCMGRRGGHVTLQQEYDDNFSLTLVMARVH